MVTDRKDDQRIARKVPIRKVDMITQTRLKELLQYDPNTGVFTWIKSGRGRRANVAGSIGKRGYIEIGIDSNKYLAHRLAWLFVYGHMPLNILDHIDHNTSNNSIDNLRDVSKAENAQNQVKATRSNKSSCLIGVNFHKCRGVYRAAITTNGVKKQIGVFTSAEEAHKAYVKEKRKLHSTCTI